MPTYTIMQHQQELIRNLNSLTENYEQDVKKASDVVANAKEAAKIAHRTKMQKAETYL